MDRISNHDLADRLQKMDEESRSEDMALWGGVAGMSSSGQTDLFNSDKFKAIVAILQQQPLLVQPALTWLQAKQAELARVQLEALYTPEQLEQMVSDASANNESANDE